MGTTAGGILWCGSRRRQQVTSDFGGRGGRWRGVRKREQKEGAGDGARRQPFVARISSGRGAQQETGYQSTKIQEQVVGGARDKKQDVNKVLKYNVMCKNEIDNQDCPNASASMSAV